MNKDIKIYWKDKIEAGALEQFNKVMEIPCIIKWALMPDAHSWTVLPIGWVVASKWQIFPAFVGVDIWCGVLAYKTEFKRKDIEWLEQQIFEDIYKYIPCWEWKSRAFTHEVHLRMEEIEHTKLIDDVMKKWQLQLWTLGGWNHFIEIAYDENDCIWIVVHSWSRWVWYKVAKYYMQLARGIQEVDWSKYEKEFEDSNIEFKKYNLEKFEEKKWEYVEKKIQEELWWSYEWTFWLDVESKNWKNYINDMNFCLTFALTNRKIMAVETYLVLHKHLKIDFDLREAFIKIDEECINRNHNHAEEKDWLWIHRKWANHAEKWMLWVIPGNMRDWSFIVEGLWNPESLCSSSHWWGRVLWRKQAMRELKLEDFEKSMEWIVAKVDEKTLDESPAAYKDIFEVMDLQKDLVKVLHHLKPIINVKW